MRCRPWIAQWRAGFCLGSARIPRAKLGGGGGGAHERVSDRPLTRRAAALQVHRETQICGLLWGQSAKSCPWIVRVVEHFEDASYIYFVQAIQ